MVYSNKAFPRKEYEFPPPPEWLVWQQAWRWDSSTRQYKQLDEGTVRHMSSLQKAKKRVSPYGSKTFHNDWAIYKWDGVKYVEVYSGKRGEPKDDNPLFKERVKKTTTVRELDESEVEAALASIGRAL